MNAIRFKDVWVMYRIKFAEEGKVWWDNFWALKGISFEVEEAHVLGIIGENGAGKSTILKLIAGILAPDRGQVQVKGRVSGLLELGAGFQPELTGRENIYLCASLFGLSQSQIDKKYQDIVNFASLGRFINAPVKCYSQGMFVRLAFSVAIHMDPQILLIDDTLAVGDEHFQRKCIKKIFELKEQGKTIVVVAHDINILRQLCKRLIFLKEGRIIKDAKTEKVIPFYTQMVGAKCGVGILERKPLNLVFNNGRLFLNWQEKLLTPNSGIHAIFRVEDKWYSSLQADWEVEKKENKLVAKGKLYSLALTQIWRLEVVDGCKVKLDIEMESEQPLQIPEGCTNIMLANEYTQWFTSLERGVFSSIDDKSKNWQTFLDDNVFRRCIGVEAKDTPNGRNPSLVIEQDDDLPKRCVQIFNADYFTNCRILQCKAFGLQNYSATGANRFRFFSGRIILDIPDINIYLKKLESEFTLSWGKSKIVFNGGRGIFSWDGEPLTKHTHMNTSVYANGRWYSSQMANWEIKKEKENVLIARGKWHVLPITQVWRIEMRGDSSFLWEVNLEVARDVYIEEQHIQCMYTEAYKYWFTDYDKGIFPTEYLNEEIDMTQRCISEGRVGFQSDTNQLPAVFVKFSKSLNNFAKIFNSDFYNRARILRIEKVQPERETKFLPGEYPCFKIEVSLGKSNLVSIEDPVSILQDGKLRFVFDKGKGALWWEGRELTKRFGLYTSLRSEGRWYDSHTQAAWDIEERTPDTLKVLGRWLYLPIKQYWKIKLEKNNIIEFSVKLRVDRRIIVDRLQTNIMLSENYKEWLANNDKGFFPAFKGNIDDDWQVLWSGPESTKKSQGYIGALKNYEGNNYLPTVKFFPQNIDSAWHLCIINSDLYHRGRVLQYLKKGEISLSPGEYLYYQGKIVIEER
jgi:ABC-type polysaccharide/polyol phosphate transport system ATPase subunit